jgi:hypothetical protein
MAAGVVVTCPNCEKKFKPKSDVAGKKIKCPFCMEPFVVPAAKEAKAGKSKSEAAGSGKPVPAEAKASAPVVAAAPPVEDDDNDVNPYGVKTVEIVPRCPNCTQEMGEHDTICLSCGYNTMTREWGKTQKTLALTFQRHLKYLLPAIGAAVFAFFSVVFMIYYTVVSPYDVEGVPLLYLTDSEAIRMWTAVIFLFWLWCAGIFCYKKFIEKPKPDELLIEESSDKPKKPAKA